MLPAKDQSTSTLEANYMLYARDPYLSEEEAERWAEVTAELRARGVTLPVERRYMLTREMTYVESVYIEAVNEEDARRIAQRLEDEQWNKELIASTNHTCHLFNTIGTELVKEYTHFVDKIGEADAKTACGRHFADEEGLKQTTKVLEVNCFYCMNTHLYNATLDAFSPVRD